MSSSPKPCPHCGKPWWDGWQKCPHCDGRPARSVVAKQAEPTKAGLMSGFALIAIIVVIGALLASRLPDPTKADNPSTSTSPSHSTVGAWTVCTDAVRDRLRAPRTAKFPWGYDDKVTHLGEGKYHARAYVDAQNAFGAMVRTDFECTVQWITGNRWRIEELVLE